VALNVRQPWIRSLRGSVDKENMADTLNGFGFKLFTDPVTQSLFLFFTGGYKLELNQFMLAKRTFNLSLNIFAKAFLCNDDYRFQIVPDSSKSLLVCVAQCHCVSGQSLKRKRILAEMALQINEEYTLFSGKAT